MSEHLTEDQLNHFLMQGRLVIEGDEFIPCEVADSQYEICLPDNTPITAVDEMSPTMQQAERIQQALSQEQLEYAWASHASRAIVFASETVQQATDYLVENAEAIGRLDALHRKNPKKWQLAIDFAGRRIQRCGLEFFDDERCRKRFKSLAAAEFDPTDEENARIIQRVDQRVKNLVYDLESLAPDLSAEATHTLFEERKQTPIEDINIQSLAQQVPDAPTYGANWERWKLPTKRRYLTEQCLLPVFSKVSEQTGTPVEDLLPVGAPNENLNPKQCLDLLRTQGDEALDTILLPLEDADLTYVELGYTTPPPDIPHYGANWQRYTEETRKRLLIEKALNPFLEWVALQGNDPPEIDTFGIDTRMHPDEFFAELMRDPSQFGMA